MSRAAAPTTDNPDRKIDKKLGQMLVERGRITGEQLIRAIQSQRALGGRIGTCLLEMEVLSEDELLHVLAEQLRVPAVGVEQLRIIDHSILDMVPEKMAARFEAIPFFASADELRVATLNVRHLAFLDELRYLTNRRVVPHIANEVRIFEGLQRHYGIEIPRRFNYLLDRLNRSRFMWDESAKLLLGQAAMDWTDPDQAFGGSLSKVQGVIHSPSGLGSTRGAVAVPKGPAKAVAPARPAAPEAPQLDNWPAGVLSLEQVAKLLANEGDAERVAELVIRFAAQNFSRTALFKVHKSKVYGWRVRGEDMDQKLFRALELNLDEPSLFHNLAQGAQFHLGALPAMPAHRQMARVWGGQLPSECMLVPIRVRNHMVSVLYGDRGPLGLHGVDIDRFRRLADHAGEALELCILRKKIKSA